MTQTLNSSSENKQTKVERREPAVVIYPRLPEFDGIFNLPAATCVASHTPHKHIEEHLHDHLHHMHIRYGFEIPAQEFDEIQDVAFEVAMSVRVEHRVDCNPPFTGRGPGAEGLPLRLGEEVIHWVYSDEVGKKAKRLFESTGRKLPEGFYFQGFRTSDEEERHELRLTRKDLEEVFGGGLRCDQHFQATWKEPKDEAIEPYDVIIYLGDDVTNYHTFFRLPVVVPIGAF